MVPGRVQARRNMGAAHPARFGGQKAVSRNDFISAQLSLDYSDRTWLTAFGSSTDFGQILITRVAAKLGITPPKA